MFRSASARVAPTSSISGSSDESVGNPREDLGQIDGACRSVVTAKKWKVEARCYGQEGCGWVLGDGWGDPFGEGR